MIAHPPCTYLTNSGVRWLADKNGIIRDINRYVKMRDAALFFGFIERNKPRQSPQPQHSSFGFVFAPHPRLHYLSIVVIKPDVFSCVSVHYGVFNAEFSVVFNKECAKEECRIALGLPEGTKPKARIHKMAPGPDRQRLRLITYQCIANAMAEQWSNL